MGLREGTANLKDSYDWLEELVYLPKIMLASEKGLPTSFYAVHTTSHCEISVWLLPPHKIPSPLTPGLSVDTSFMWFLTWTLSLGSDWERLKASLLPYPCHLCVFLPLCSLSHLRPLYTLKIALTWHDNHLIYQDLTFYPQPGKSCSPFLCFHMRKMDITTQNLKIIGGQGEKEAETFYINKVIGVISLIVSIIARE